MDTPSPSTDDCNDYVSDSCRESSQSDYDLDIKSHNESALDIEFGDPNTCNLDLSVPDIKANPPKWTDKIQSITVPPPKNKGRPKLEPTFGDQLWAVDYFQLFLMIHYKRYCQIYKPVCTNWNNVGH